MQEKVSLMGFSERMEISVPRITVLAGTRRSLVTRQTQLSLATDISIRTSNHERYL